MTITETIITDIYDAWRAQDLEWLASYLPEDFSHMVYVPTEIHPLGGLCSGKLLRSKGGPWSRKSSICCATIPAT